MLSHLLVALLCAASNSASPLPVSVADPAPQAPIAATSPMQTSAVGPLAPGSWGIGFRVLGTRDDLVLRRAFSDRLSAGLKVSWAGAISETFEEREESYSPGNDFYESERTSWALDDVSNFSIVVGFPIEWIQTNEGPVRFAIAVGPNFQYSRFRSETSQMSVSDGLGSSPPVERISRDASIGIGAAGSVGMRWFFLPKLALAADFGSSAMWDHRTNRATSDAVVGSDGWNRTWSENENDQVRTVLSFHGVGLEAWF